MKCRFCLIICILSRINARKEISISPVNDKLEIQITDLDNSQHFLIIEKPGRKFEKEYTSNRTYQYKDLYEGGIYPSDPIHFTIFGFANNSKVLESFTLTIVFNAFSIRKNRTSQNDPFERLNIFMRHFNLILIKNVFLIRQVWSLQ